MNTKPKGKAHFAAEYEEFSLHASEVSKSCNLSDESMMWYIDSACSSHITPNAGALVNKIADRRPIQEAEEGRTLYSESIGELVAQTKK